MYFVVANILLLISESISSSSPPIQSAIEPWQPEPWTPVVAHSRPSRSLVKPAWTRGEEMITMKRMSIIIRVGKRVKDLAIFFGLSSFLGFFYCVIIIAQVNVYIYMVSAWTQFFLDSVFGLLSG